MLHAPLSPDEAATVAEYFDRVKKVASNLKTRLPPHVDEDELTSAGVTGLIESLRRYDPSVGVKFWSFAGRRVHGAMLDWLREIDPVGRSARRREAAGGPPAPATISLNMTVSDAGEGRDSDVELWRSLVDRRSFAKETGDADIWEFINDSLGPRFRWFVEQRYRHQRRLKDIARDIGLTESRMCQVDKEVREVLRRNRIMTAAGLQDESDARLREPEAAPESQHVVDFRTQAQKDEDAKLPDDQGTWYRCPRHGHLQKPLLMGDYRYCPKDPCDKQVLLVAGRVELRPDQISRDGAGEPQPQMRKTSAPRKTLEERGEVFGKRDFRKYPRLDDLIYATLKETDLPMRLNALCKAALSNGFKPNQVSPRLLSLERRGILEKVGLGLYRLGEEPLPPPSKTWESRRQEMLNGGVRPVEPGDHVPAPSWKPKAAPKLVFEEAGGSSKETLDGIKPLREPLPAPTIVVGPATPGPHTWVDREPAPATPGGVLVADLRGKVRFTVGEDTFEAEGELAWVRAAYDMWLRATGR